MGCVVAAGGCQHHEVEALDLQEAVEVGDDRRPGELLWADACRSGWDVDTAAISSPAAARRGAWICLPAMPYPASPTRVMP